MSPKEKAQFLVDKLYQTTADMRYYNPLADTIASRYDPWNQAKQCAIIAVEETTKDIKSIEFNYDIDLSPDIKYLESVKTEIEKL